MKKLAAITIMILLGAAFGPAAALSGERSMPAPATHSGDFGYLKTFIGAWEGKADMGKGMETVKATYELASAGNAIVERLFAERPMRW